MAESNRKKSTRARRSQRQPPSARRLKRRLPQLRRAFAADSRVLGVWLFGSLVDGYATPRSDIDLAVLFDREVTFDEETSFELAVRDALGPTQFDVVNLNRADLSFRYRAVLGKLLYARDEVRVADFIERTLIAYRDYGPRLQRRLDDYFVALGERYASRTETRSGEN